MSEFQKWPSIDQFHTVRKYIRKYRHVLAPEPGDVIQYVGSVKLHGTNGGVRYNPDGTITAQSRNRDLTVENDNFGFARFVQEREDILRRIRPEGISVLFGEFVGKGIQNKVALAECPRHWVIFGGLDAEGNEVPLDDFAPLHRPPVAPPCNESDIYWVNHCYGGSWGCTIDPHGDERHFADLAEGFTQFVLDVEAECPWAQYNFGVSGVGEGVVWTPLGKHFGDSRLRFKTKGEKHKKGSKKGTQVRAGSLATNSSSDAIRKFLDEYVTADRAQQVFVEQCGSEASMRQTGIFLAGMGRDIKKESTADLESLGLEWKKVAKVVTVTCKDMWCNFIRTGEWQ